MSDDDLFSGLPPYARGSDTSKEAAERIAGRVRADCARVLAQELATMERGKYDRAKGPNGPNESV